MTSIPWLQNLHTVFPSCIFSTPILRSAQQHGDAKRRCSGSLSLLDDSSSAWAYGACSPRLPSMMNTSIRHCLSAIVTCHDASNHCCASYLPLRPCHFVDVSAAFIRPAIGPAPLLGAGRYLWTPRGLHVTDVALCTEQNACEPSSSRKIRTMWADDLKKHI